MRRARGCLGGPCGAEAGRPEAPLCCCVCPSRQIYQPLCFRLARKLAFNHARRFLGLHRCPQLFNMGLGLPQATRDYFLSLDMPVFELYGLSESSGIHTLSRQQDFRLLRWVPVEGRTAGAGQGRSRAPHPSGVQRARGHGPHVGVSTKGKGGQQANPPVGGPEALRFV